MKSNVGVSSLIPSWMHLTWTAITESTSTVILLNSSKQPHAPERRLYFWGIYDTCIKLQIACLCKTLEDISTGLVVHLLGAVEDIDRHANGPEQNETCQMSHPCQTNAPPIQKKLSHLPRSFVVSVFPVPAGPWGAPPITRCRDWVNVM